MNPPAKLNWWSRNWKWFVPVGCFSICLLFAGFIALIMTFAFGVMRSSDAYKVALARAKASPAVVEALGTPIQEGYFTSGNVNVTGPSGNAELSIPISGPKGNGTIYLEARKSAGEWSFSKLLVKIEKSSKRIDLLAEPGTPPKDSRQRGPDRDRVTHPPLQPRYAASTLSFLCSSAGVPSSAIRPRSMT